ncbi:ABC transporter permease [Nonomuraea sp. NPDC050663]|uniref:ABC transporter permease n=1 Tax=Nonomuraea sp. NPDC050663 TaxID=3364370 RepID=UPI0037B43AF7
MRRVLYASGAAGGVLLLGTILHPGFASWPSLQAMLVVASFTGFVAAGQMLVVLVGGIDLSIPWVLNGAAIMLTTTALGQPGRLPYALLVALAVGAAAGLANGLGVAWLGVPAVVMTLGMNGVLQGLSLGLSKGLTCATCGSYAPEPLRGLFPLGALLVWAGVALLVTVVLTLTTFGRRVYAVGVNPRAAYLAGVGVRGVTVALYTLSGVFAALAGVMLVGYGGQPSLGLGDPYLFESIAAVVVGGVSILGGRGHYAGVVAGALTLVAVTTFLQAQRVPEYGRLMIYGLVILVILLAYGRTRAHD